MRNVVALALLGLGILTMPKGCDPGGAPKAHASLPSFVALQCAEVALTRDDVGPAPTPNNKVPRAQCTQCNGTGRIVHGDGHSTECTHCFAFYGPQQLEGGVPIQLARYPADGRYQPGVRL